MYHAGMAYKTTLRPGLVWAMRAWKRITALMLLVEGEVALIAESDLPPAKAFAVEEI